MLSVPFIDIHSHEKELDTDVLSLLNINITDRNFKTSPQQNYSLGIAPWDIKTSEMSLEEMQKFFCLNPNFIALGEIGLDRRLDTSLSEQKDIFVKQLAIAKQLKKPVIIHCVKANAELIQIKKNFDTKTAWIFHAFNKNVQISESLLKNGFYLSFGEALIYNTNLQSIFKSMPNHRIFFETDSSQISIKKLYQKASELKAIDLSVLKTQIWQNHLKCFNR